MLSRIVDYSLFISLPMLLFATGLSHGWWGGSQVMPGIFRVFQVQFRGQGRLCSDPEAGWSTSPVVPQYPMFGLLLMVLPVLAINGHRPKSGQKTTESKRNSPDDHV